MIFTVKGEGLPGPKVALTASPNAMIVRVQYKKRTRNRGSLLGSRDRSWNSQTENLKIQEQYRE